MFPFHLRFQFNFTVPFNFWDTMSCLYFYAKVGMQISWEQESWTCHDSMIWIFFEEILRGSVIFEFFFSEWLIICLWQFQNINCYHTFRMVLTRFLPRSRYGGSVTPNLGMRIVYFLVSIFVSICVSFGRYYQYVTFCISALPGTKNEKQESIYFWGMHNLLNLKAFGNLTDIVLWADP